jgi:dephospho-CoA kinase
MAGAGKSVAGKFLESTGYRIIKLGSYIIGEIRRRDLAVTPSNEKLVREALRQERGMSAVATLALPELERLLLESRHVAIEGLFNLAEYDLLQETLQRPIIIIALATSKRTRYERLAKRRERSLTPSEAIERDLLEIKTVDKAGPIALADFTIINDGEVTDLHEKMSQVIEMIHEQSDWNPKGDPMETCTVLR